MSVHPASYSVKLQENKVKCTLCPHLCVIADGKTGLCRVRKNDGGTLISEVYGKACCLRFDPIEKKPLYHFYPGSSILSVGSVGCNLRCKFCQNWEISQTCAEDYPYLKPASVDEIIRMAGERHDNAGIAFTYNEPVIWFEFMVDIARKSKEKGLRNVMVSNGYINAAPLSELLGCIDAFNIDLKAFTDDFYRRVTGGRLQPVKDTLSMIRKHNRHLELTHLVVTDLNDDDDQFEEMVRWIGGELGPETPLHLSRYFPNFELENKATPLPKLLHLYEMATQYLRYVYLGNVAADEGRITVCPDCGASLIERIGYSTYKKGLDAKGRCRKCSRPVINYIETA
ncbi:MAG: AmmeMemoRadiSam system radical SAM enzyme [Bacteroidales bacterium]|nr:AmmeMemoRadiSam system radical SAM enzyme [Bacteroidales bacterium]